MTLHLPSRHPRHKWAGPPRTNVARMLEDEERRRHNPHPPMVERERAPVPVALAGYAPERVEQLRAGYWPGWAR